MPITKQQACNTLAKFYTENANSDTSFRLKESICGIGDSNEEGFAYLCRQLVNGASNDPNEILYEASNNLSAFLISKGFDATNTNSPDIATIVELANALVEYDAIHNGNKIITVDHFLSSYDQERSSKFMAYNNPGPMYHCRMM